MKQDRKKKLKSGIIQLITGIVLLFIGVGLTVASYNSTASKGYFYAYTGIIMLGIYFTISGIYDTLHPKKKFEDINFANLAKKFIIFIIILFCVLLLLAPFFNR